MQLKQPNHVEFHAFFVNLKNPINKSDKTPATEILLRRKNKINNFLKHIWIWQFKMIIFLSRCAHSILYLIQNRSIEAIGDSKFDWLSIN